MTDAETFLLIMLAALMCLGVYGCIDTAQTHKKAIERDAKTLDAFKDVRADILRMNAALSDLHSRLTQLQWEMRHAKND